MEEISFQALGTKWSITLDGKKLKDEEKKELLVLVDNFEERFSRFRDSSEVNQFRVVEPGEYQISSAFSDILRTASILRELTAGVFDPAVATLLEHAGYDQSYRLTPNSLIEGHKMSQWSLSGIILTLSGPIAFDLGGIGKGYCIDLVATFLKNHNRQFFLVEAGGDMYATQKSDGSAFRIALEWPGKPGVAYGTLELKHAGFAASDSFRRRWPAPVKAGRDEKDWHHIVNPITKKPIQKIIGCAAVAPSAFYADCMTSGLFLSERGNYEKIAKQFSGQYVVFGEKEDILVSDNWPGELFS